MRLLRYGNLTQALAARGHEVCWWTSNFSHARKCFITKDDVTCKEKGVTFRILAGPGYMRNVSFGRFRHSLHFARRFYEEALRSARPDIIVSPVPTLDVAEAAVQYAIACRVPILTDIRDEWPDELVNLAPKQLRIVAKGVLSSYFKKMAFVCKNVSGIMGISQQQLHYGLKFAERQQEQWDGVFPLGYSAYLPSRDKIEAAKSWWYNQGLKKNVFTACLFSSINPRVNFETIIDAAKILEKEFPTQFVLCGNGRSFEKLQRMAKTTTSVLVPGWVDGPQIAALMELSDIGIAPYASNTRMALPNKLFEYFAGGLPVISSIQGEAKELLAEADCGRTYHSNNVNELCAHIRELVTNPDHCRAMGRRARKLFEENYSDTIIHQKFEQHFIKVIAEAGTENRGKAYDN